MTYQHQLFEVNIQVKTCFASVINMYVFLQIKIETNIHSEQRSYLPAKIWKYGGSVLGIYIQLEELKQSNPLNVTSHIMFLVLKTIAFS